MRGNRRLVALWAAVALLMSGMVTVATAAPFSPKLFIAPVSAEEIRGFEPPSHRFGPGHRGIDYGVASETAVRASGTGTVRFAGTVANDLFVTIEHSGGIVTTYSFLSRTDVSAGDPVAQGQIIGASGEGHPDGPPGLHFGAKLNGEYIDPRLLLTELDDISDLLQLQPAGGTADAGDAAFRTLPASAFVGPEIITEPDEVSGVTQMPPGIAPLLELVRPDPVERGGPAVSGPQPTGVPSKAGLPVLNGGFDLGEVPPRRSRPPASGRPQEGATWWSGLTEQERVQMIASAPARIGRMEGLPAAVRNAANRKALEQETEYLSRERAALSRRLRDLEGRYGSRYSEYGNEQRSAEIRRTRDRLQTLKQRLTNARHLRDSLARSESKPGDGLSRSEVYLLDFDTAFVGGEGRAVVALGNPDSAENVGIVVPGVNNRLSNFSGTLAKAAKLRQSVFDLHENAASRTSTIAWLGYDTPESVFDAMDRGEARAGAKRLSAFVKNLRAARQHFGNKGGRFTIFGHSHGSTTSALAARDGLVVDNLALVGSPGAAVTHAKHLVGAKRVWAGRAWDDIIRFGTGFALLGDDPTNRSFGAIRIPTCCERIGHGGYFDLNTRSAQNLARILIGEYADVS